MRNKTIKAVLFDIDGTLLNCNRAGRHSLMQASHDVFGTAGRMERIDFQGKTDPVILHESLSIMGYDEEKIQESIGALKQKYFQYLGENIRRFDVELKPGIMEILDETGTAENIITGILTGNFKESASIKLKSHGLNRFFEVGIYGDDGITRNDLPPVARERIKETKGLDIEYTNMIIIGDTVYDIDCAKNVGALSIAVGTGWAEKEDLINRGPDYYFDDLSDTEAVMDIILH